MAAGRKTKILHIIKSLGRGGAEMLLPETLRYHDRVSFDFHYMYFLPWKDAMVQSIRDLGGNVTCVPARNNIELLMRVARVVEYLRKNDIQLIHAHLPWAGVVARLAGRIAAVPVIYTEHNKLERYHWVTRILNLLTINFLSRLVAVSDDVARSVRKYKPRLKVPLQTIVNGVDTTRFAPGAADGSIVRQQLGIPPGAPVIGTVAVFRSQKRLELWIEIAAMIRKRIPGTHFILVGDGPYREKLVLKVAALKMEECLHFAGVQTDVRPYMAAFDLYMMTSVFEGLPIALLEALACGCPVISTDAGGVKEVIRHDADGMTCPVEQPLMLVDFAIELLNDPQKRKRLSLYAREKIESRFSMEKMVKELETCYLGEISRGQYKS